MAQASGSVFRVACVQMTSSREMDSNIRTASALIREAHDAGADLVATPEMTSLIEPRARPLLDKVYREPEDPALAAFRALAESLKLWLLIGSLPIAVEDGMVANRSFLIDASGAIVARYDKIHMFDVDLPDGQTYLESKSYRPGSRAVVAPTPWGKLGLTVCYDVRFPHLYRALAQAGASMLSVPAAFTQYTGEAHWHVLLRARAIECGAFVIAPAQTGRHDSGRHTFGHSLIVDPWGRVLADGGTAPGVVLATIDLAQVEATRRKVPSLRHDRPFTGP